MLYFVFAEPTDENGELCLYCPSKYSQNTKASHLGKHWNLEFQCGECPTYFATVDQTLHHVKGVHAKEENEEEGFDKIKLVKESKILPPRDLRALLCYICELEGKDVGFVTIITNEKRVFW